MFVRRKKVKGNIYYQLVRNYREDGKHRQQFLCHLGRHKSLEAAIAAERELAEEHEDKAAHWSEEARLTKELLHEEYGEEIGHTVPSRRQADLRWRAFWKEYRQKYLMPYERWRWVRLSAGLDAGMTTEEFSLRADRLKEQLAEQRAAEQKVWDERRRLWNERKEHEETLSELIGQYHFEVSEARRYKRGAAFHRARLRTFLEAKQKYCS